MDDFKLASQICFPVYTLAKEMINHYRPLLDELDLTYPQYLVMMVLWEEQQQTVGQLGEKLKLDNGTLTPLLKRLEHKGYVSRTRSKQDERVVHIVCTDLGSGLRDKACGMREKVLLSMNVSTDDLVELKALINKILNKKN